MVLKIHKASEKIPPIGVELYAWGMNLDDELELLGPDVASELVVWEVNEDGSLDEEYTQEVENELLKAGFILNIGWENGENVHNDDYWSYKKPEPFRLNEEFE